jgi:tRNA-2-methylthio-N6-dimethylallyladenosine synthase
MTQATSTSQTDAGKQVPAPGRRQKKVFVKTYGCQMNVYDSERMVDALRRDGWTPTVDSVDDADLVLLNTCHIREKAAEKVYSAAWPASAQLKKTPAIRPRAGTHDGRRRRLRGAGRRRGNRSRRAAAGRSRRRPADLSPPALSSSPEPSKGERGMVETEFPAEDKFDRLPDASAGTIRTRGVTAFLTVQEGCDKFCTFCVVPYTRGAEVSRPVERIVSEAGRLAAAGVREITLLGQNVNAWHGQGSDGREWGLGELMHRLADHRWPRPHPLHHQSSA